MDDFRLGKNKRNDGWYNIYTYQGIQGKDKQLGAGYSAPRRFAETTLDDVYRGDGFARRVIDLPTKEMIKNGFQVAGDTDGEIYQYLKTKDLNPNLLRTLQWARVFGGSIMLLGINDGGKLEEPVREESIKEIEFFKVYNRYRVTWTTADLYDDPAEKKYGTPKLYSITPIHTGVPGEEFKVHESRVIVMDGMDVSDRARVENDGWGDSYISHMWTQLMNLSGAYFSAKNVIDDFIQTILKVKNLAQLLEAGKDELVKERLNILDLGRHLINTMMIDGDEEFSKHASSVSGMAELIDRFGLAVSAVSGIPFTLLMGQSPAGLNATGDSDIRLWYDSVAQEQEATLLKPVQRIVYLTMLSKMGPTNGKVIEDWKIVFNPLWLPTAKEIAETRKIVAETDNLYIHNSTLDPEEVAESRFGGNEYSMETSIDMEKRSMDVDDNPDEVE